LAEYLIHEDNSEYQRQVFVKKSEIKKFIKLVEKAESKGSVEILTEKEKDFYVRIHTAILKEEFLDALLSFENPWSAKRDDVRNTLNQKGHSFTSYINLLEAENYKDLKNKILEEAQIYPQEEPEEVEYIDRLFFEKEEFTRDDSNLSHSRGYFVTAIVGNMSLNISAFQTVINFCEKKGYELVLLPMKNAIRNRIDREERDISEYPYELHPYIETSFFTEYIFNENIRAKDFLLLPQQKNPLTGLGEYGKKQYSLIIASPKQDLETISVAKDKHPHLVHSTGTLSLPDGYFNDRTGRIALEDHVMGGLIVEIKDEKNFFLRQVQFDADGGFNDIDEYYYGKKTKKAECVAVTWGDLHNQLESKETFEATCEWTKILNPKQIYLQDSVDMHSVNPHHLKSIYDRVHKFPEIDTLPKELEAFGKKLISLNKLFPNTEIVDVPSNHPYFLTRYLDDPNGTWLKDRPENIKTASELFYVRINNIETNPIKYWIQKYFPETEKFMRWPSQGESIEITDKEIEMNVHGHAGPNGAKGAKRGIRLSYHNANQAHSHGPFIFGGIWGSGVMGHDHGYNNNAPSNWLAANIAVYQNGQRQMQIIARESIEWRLLH
jgi:hypothetical protein